MLVVERKGDGVRVVVRYGYTIIELTIEREGGDQCTNNIFNSGLVYPLGEHPLGDLIAYIPAVFVETFTESFSLVEEEYLVPKF